MTPIVSWRSRAITVFSILAGLALLTSTFGMGGAQAKGGTAKPPPGVPPAAIVPVHPAVPAPVFNVLDANGVPDVHQFDVTGFIQDATVDGGAMCPAAAAGNRGGTLLVNGVTITVPCNSIVQMPANTLTWADVFAPGQPPLTIKDLGYPSFEAHVVGNIVGGRHIAGLVYLSQQGANSGQGVITRIDYNDGSIYVGAKIGSPDQVRLQINDPNGRFGRAQSPDPRFSVDDANPTIHGGTGYPMCVPRTDPAGADDPLCPQRNRPRVVQGCRTFVQAGVSPLPAGGDIAPAPGGQVYCTHFVTKDPNGVLAATDPDARQQAPFEVGDYISYSGTLLKGAAAAGDYISVHTIEANVGIYTQPGTTPAYIAIGEFGLGSADPTLVAVNGAAQETQDRIFLEAETSDVKTPVDIYLIDKDPASGSDINRWVSPFEMTGETNGPNLVAGAAVGSPIGGGITTQFVGAQKQRARLRATKAPLGFLTSPTRYLRVVQRSLCLPTSTAIGGSVNIGGIPAIDDTTTTAGNVKCVERKPAANGLFTGQYLAPVFEYIFPENVSVGDPVVPNDLWDLGFLVNGEGPGTGALVPTPW